MDRANLTAILDQFRPDLAPFEVIYKDLHQHPELSLQEDRTAAIIAKHLRSLPGFDVVDAIGGHGVAGVLRNGPGKTILLRADMDALPVEEKTGLPYSSKELIRDLEDGITKPVMHACGHDMHVTCLLAAATTLHSAQAVWQGTVIALFQPNEERAGGAQAMVDDSLYERVPVPDVVLGQHVMPFKAGTIGTRVGLMASAADSFRVTLYGRGGHASQPHRTVDPVLMAAHLVVRLQTIVSREVAPSEPAVITIGSIQAGMTENIIADHAVVKVNVRTFSAETRKKVLASIERIVKAESDASNATREPLIEQTSLFPFTVNDVRVTNDVEKSFSEHFGDRYNSDIPMLQGSEDFPILATSKQVPYCYWVFGGTDPQHYEKAEREGTLLEDVPINHSAFFAPVIQPTMETGVDGLAVAALAFLMDK